jgi:hypothetical protein
MVDKKELLSELLSTNVKARLENLEKRFKNEGADIIYLENTVDVMKSNGFNKFRNFKTV